MVIRRFGRACYLHFQGGLRIELGLMEMASYSGTPDNRHQSIRCLIPIVFSHHVDLCSALRDARGNLLQVIVQKWNCWLWKYEKLALGRIRRGINPLNPELNPICYLLALLGAHHYLHVSRIRVKILTFRRLMSYIYIYIWSTHSWCF